MTVEWELTTYFHIFNLTKKPLLLIPGNLTVRSIFNKTSNNNYHNTSLKMRFITNFEYYNTVLYYVIEFFNFI